MAKSLNQILKKSNKIADFISERVSKNAPKRKGPKGGTLQKALRNANNFNTMLDLQKGTSKIVPIKKITFTIDYNPTEAPYGMWWNDPTVSRTVKNGKTKNIPDKINFVENALKEPKVQQSLNELYDLIGQMVVTDIVSEIE